MVHVGELVREPAFSPEVKKILKVIRRAVCWRDEDVNPLQQVVPDEAYQTVRQVHVLKPLVDRPVTDPLRGAVQAHLVDAAIVPEEVHSSETVFAPRTPWSDPDRVCDQVERRVYRGIATDLVH